MITIFKDLFHKDQPVYVSVDKVLTAIRNGKYKDKIHQIRQEDDKSTRARLKNGLMCVCFSGRFKTRRDSDLIEHSGLVVLDFDHLKDVQKTKDEIIKDPYTFAAFISPSGDGLKVLVKIPPKKEDHEHHYYALIHKYPNLDSTSKNLSRVCFASYDPELYYNPDSDVFTEKGRVVETTRKQYVEAQETDHLKLSIAADMIRMSADGNKHHNLIRASRLVGGFIAGGLVEEHEAVRVLQSEINQKDINDFKRACKTIGDGIEYGKKSPIYADDYRRKVQEIRESEIIVEDEPPKDVVFLNDVRDKIKYSYKHGTSRGETTHFPYIDYHFRHKRGEVTLMHGIGNHGKSQLLLQLLLVKAVKNGYKYAVFSPENMPEDEFYKELIHTLVGESPEKFHTNQMSESSLDSAMDYLHEHFFLVYPKDDAPTPQYINTRFRELLIKKGIDGCVIDPYNQLDNDMTKKNNREDQYISMFLTAAKRFAVEHNLFYYIITHPRGNLNKDGVDYECPNVFDLSGGAMWNNKCDNILVAHRPFYTSDKNNTEVHFKSQKIKKQKLNGIPGDVTLFFDRMTARYYQTDGYNPLGSQETTQESAEEIEKLPF